MMTHHFAETNNLISISIDPRESAAKKLLQLLFPCSL